MMFRLPFLLLLYRAATTLAEPLLIGWLHWRVRKGREDPARLDERRGLAGFARPPAPLVWLHGASVGETLSIVPLIERLAQKGLAVIVTSGTVTSAALLAKRLPPGAIHQYAPIDVPRYAKRFVAHWRPDLVLIAESELWPNMILEVGRRGIPLVLVNGRLSQRSFRRWTKQPAAIARLLSRFALCLMQSPGDAQRLGQLGALRVETVGNLKFDVPAPPADAHQSAALSGLVSGRAVWIAASTHPGEEETIIAVHRTLKLSIPTLLTLIAPRHPGRGADVVRLGKAAGLKTARRSKKNLPERDVDLYVADTIGELGLFYRLAQAAFVGGSLVPHGGQNPIEPAKLGLPLLHGPHIHNFTDIYASIDRVGGAIPVTDANGLAEAVKRLLTQPALARECARAAAETVEALGGALERTLIAIDPFLPLARER